MKKVLLFLVVIFQLNITVAQRGQRKGNQTQMQQQMSVKAFKAENAANILFYTPAKIFKKLKIKDKNKKYQIKKSINTYNRNITEIRFLNSERLNEITVYVNEKRKEALERRDFQEMKAIQSNIREKLRPIKKDVKKAEERLNYRMKELLSEKKYKKWIKYQRAKKKKINPQVENKGKQQSKKKKKGKGNGKHMMRGGMF